MLKSSFEYKLGQNGLINGFDRDADHDEKYFHEYSNCPRSSSPEKKNEEKYKQIEFYNLQLTSS